jgi:hypothetical protein
MQERLYVEGWQRCLIKVAHNSVSGNNSESCCEEDVGSKVSSTNFLRIVYMAFCMLEWMECT